MKAFIHELTLLAALAGSVLFSGCTRGEVDVIRPEWPESVLELAAALPVQDGGRIKPFQTYADFSLLPLNGKRKVVFADKVKMSGMEWLLNTIVFPEYADDYEVFLVRDSAVIDAIGLPREGKKKSDRYSFNELMPGFRRLSQLGDQYGRIEQKDRDTIQEQIVLLASNVNHYSYLRGMLEFARFSHSLEVQGDDERALDIFDDPKNVKFSDVLANLGRIVEVHEELRDSGEDAAAGALGDTFTSAVESVAVTGVLAAMIPPPASAAEEAEWLTPQDLLDQAFVPGWTLAEEHLRALRGFEGLVASREDFHAFERELSALQGTLSALAGARGEYQEIPLELHYYKGKYVANSQVLFILSFVLMAFMWLFPNTKLLYRGTMLAVIVAMGYLIAAIVLRCIIRGRPPVSTLYETILFVTAGWALVSVVTEFINRKRIMLSAGAFLGMLGLFLANKYELVDKQDTMPSLVAVLDTNFWLATHVTAITAGYSAGLLAALISSLYLLAKLFGLLFGFKKGDKTFYRNIARMSYGVLCFALIFSLVGTILGGIWANDSWGRFWGWDPKENGALLIVISQIAILHARMGGYLRQHGLQMATAFAGTVIAFSWFGVNLLGVGLHSYGFTNGIHQALWTYYFIQWGIVAAGGVALLVERRVADALKA
jgi:ABC-type transport system involved in cytochrome c biogenesis permease subunit